MKEIPLRLFGTAPATRSLVALLLACLAPAAEVPAGEEVEVPLPSLRASVRFVQPTASQVVYGKTLLRVSVSPPARTVVRHVEFFVDGKSLGPDGVPPYEMSWNAGESARSHRFRALARFSDGTAAEDAITTRGLDLIEHEIVLGEAIEHASLLVSVVDERGEPVRGLKREDFRVRERGNTVEIDDFSPLTDLRSMPLSITVLVDRSGSMRFKEAQWRQASVELLRALRPIDQVRVSSFAKERAVIQDFTRDASAIAESTQQVGEPGGQTFLYQAVFQEVRDLRGFPGRKAVIVITDGIDTQKGTSAGLRANWTTSLMGAIERLASRSGVTVINILTQPSIQTLLPIQSLALRTGGWWTYPSTDLAGLLKRVGERLLGSYLLEYDVAISRSPDRRRKVSVSLNRENTGWEVFTSMGRFGVLTPLEALEEDLEAGSVAQRKRAVEELGQLGVEGVGRLLEEALKDDAPEVRVAALEALIPGGNPEALDLIMKRVHDKDPRVREAAFRAAIRFGPEAVEPLSKLAARSGRERGAALRALGAIGDSRAIPLLERALGAYECAVREAAADGAGLLFELTGGGLLGGEEGTAGEGQAALELLQATLDDECVAAADAAALALGRLAHPAALPRLIRIAAGAADTHRLGEALLILSTYLSPETFEALERRLVSGVAVSPESRRTAAAILAAAVRTTRWLATEEGLARVTDLGITEARTVLEELLRLGTATDASDSWLAPIHTLYRDLSRRMRPATVEDPGGGL